MDLETMIRHLMAMVAEKRVHGTTKMVIQKKVLGGEVVVTDLKALGVHNGKVTLIG